MDARRLGVVGADGVLGRRATAMLVGGGHEVVPLGPGQAPTGLDAVAVAAPWQAAVPAGDVPAVGADLGRAQVQPAGAGPTRVPHAGWWGGLGELLAAHAAAAATAPAAVHVAYALPGVRRAWARLPAGMRAGLVDLLTDDDVGARIDGAPAPEPLGEGRRLAWFPRPVGPWHSAAVPGVEARVLGRAEDAPPTVRTWVAVGSLGAELLQAVGRLDPSVGLGARLRRRALAGGGGADGTTDLRWAVVAEVRDRDGGVLRAWANGTDPVAAAAGLLASATVRAAAAPRGAGALVDLAPAPVHLDGLADAGLLRWSLSRPEPSPR